MPTPWKLTLRQRQTQEAVDTVVRCSLRDLFIFDSIPYRETEQEGGGEPESRYLLQLGEKYLKDPAFLAAAQIGKLKGGS